MLKFESKHITATVNDDGSGLEIEFRSTHLPGCSTMTPAQEIVRLSRWVVGLTTNTIEVPQDLWDRYETALETFGGTVQDHALAAMEGGAAALELGVAGVEAFSRGNSGGILSAMAQELLKDHAAKAKARSEIEEDERMGKGD